MYSVDRLINTLTRIMLYAGGVLLLSIMALTLVNIVMRGMGNGLRGGVEVSGFLGAAALGLCLPWVQKQGGHAMGGLLYEKLPTMVQRVHDVLVPLLCLLLTAAFTLELYEVGLFIYEGMEVVDGWNIPIVYFVAALTAGCAAQALVITLEIAKIFLDIFTALRPCFSVRGGHEHLCQEKKGA
ncbi:MAG: TRAP transporter small permease subunit [Pseudomonadota bacterium]